MLPATLMFEGVTLSIIDRLGRPWMTQTDLARALYGIAVGYRDLPLGDTEDRKGGWQDDTPLKRALNSLRRLYDRNKDEFTDGMTAMLTMETAGGPQQVRIFSARGCYLLAMLAKTERAKAFRKWVLDVLEGKVGQTGQSVKDEIALARARTAEKNATRGLLHEIRMSSGPSEAAKAAPALLKQHGIILNPDDAESRQQRDMGFPPAVPPEGGPLKSEEPPSNAPKNGAAEDPKGEE